MNRIAIAFLATAAAAAAQAQTFNDVARVRHVEPQYENVSVPRQQCHSQWVTEHHPAATHRNYGGLVLGGIVGGVAGNQIGKGHGREAATAVGAVVGALAGDHLANQNGSAAYPHQPVQRQVQHCQTVSEVHSRISGYRVTYEYQGQSYTTLMRDNPGRSIPVQVSVTPLQAEYHGQYRQH